MHIPDGYLSPETCAALYVASAPFWAVALNRVKLLLNTRMVPLLSVFAAFSFVIMMFNIPLPGGTTGHAIGVGIAAIVLGPWGSMLAVSVALLIQALFFGDGGITAFAANSFNMAIVGSLIASLVYRIVGRGSGLTSVRRVVAAGLAGYAAINAAAFVASLEFGIQPLLFHDAAGAPLYAPYPLSIAVPAMMIGHITVAGLAEMIAAAGVVAYLQRSDPSLLKMTAPDAPDIGEVASFEPRSLRKLWLGLAALMILTPLGLLAAGTAWGEWAASDFADASSREEIAAASHGQAPPKTPPAGLERLADVWTAPIPDYAPAFLTSPALGYVMSAMFGSGLIILLTTAAAWLFGFLSGGTANDAAHAPPPQKGRRSGKFLQRTLAGLIENTERALFAEEIARKDGLLQRLDPRVKIVGLFALVLTVTTARNLATIIFIFCIGIILAALSRVPITFLASRIWLSALFFTGAIAVPVIFITAGDVIATVPFVGWQITSQGVSSALYLISRVEATATLSVLLVLCTSWTNVLKALRVLRMPVVFVVILGMTYRYIFVILETARDMFEARQSRLVGTLAGPERRRIAAGSIGVLLTKSFYLHHEVFLAMQSRGFRGEVHVLDEFVMQRRDYAAAAVFVLLAAALFWMGRQDSLLAVFNLHR